jgi:1,4-alpha-glucan branching enzyme
MGQHPDWGTSIFNYGRPQVAQFLLSSALYWLEEFHIDGLRVDAVASMLYLDYSRKEGEWVPNRFGGRENLEAIEFLKRFNAQLHERFPGALTFAEESTSWPGVSRPVHLGGLGFDLKWNLGWMHDTLEYLKQDPIYRRFHHAKMTFSLYYAWNENYLLPLSHDEVVHGKYSLLNKMSGDVPRKFANLRALYASMYAHPGKKLLFMGGEFGQWREWSEARALDWHVLDDREFGGLHRGLLAFVRELNRLHRELSALHEIDFHWDGFEWIDYADVEQSVLAYARWSKKRASHVVVAANWTPVPRPGYRIGVPAAAPYREILNSDAVPWGGGGAGNPALLHADPIEWQGQAQSIVLTLPPCRSSTSNPPRRPDHALRIPLPVRARALARSAHGVGRIPVHTFSIVARDSVTGDLGVAVQSHYFAVGPVVPWASPASARSRRNRWSKSPTARAGWLS